MQKITSGIKLTIYATIMILGLFAYTKAITGFDIRKAERFCKNSGGIQSYNLFIFETVTCFNGDAAKVGELH